MDMGEKINIWFWKNFIIGVIWIISDRLANWIDEQHWQYIHGHFILLIWIAAFCKEVLFKKEKDG